MERRKMHANLKAALRIILMMTLLFLSGNLLTAGTFAPAFAQAPQQKIQKPAPPVRPPSVAASADGVDADQGGQPDTQRGDQQLITDMRAQLDREAMDRVRYGGGGGSGFERVLSDVGGFLIFLVVMGSLLWIVRSALEHRRWHRMVKVQTETHAKLLDKFGSSQDMLAYVESEAGKRFLETPVFDAQNRRSIALPYARILWSVQLGLIAAAMGIGFLSLRFRVTPDADTAFMVFGTLLFTLGIGFLVSGGVSYVLAKYMGLLKRDENGLARSSVHSSSS
jgi:hypothetical protein